MSGKTSSAGVIRFALPWVATLALAACGGGGGGGQDPSGTTPPPPSGGSGATDGTGGDGANTGNSPATGGAGNPDTVFLTTPPPLTNSADASFTFSSDQATASFEVSLDGGGFTAGASPHTLNGLPDGQHTFTVRAVASDGTLDSSPAQFAWTIDTQPPTITLQAAPQSVTTATDADFALQSNEAPVTFEVSLDGGAFQTLAGNDLALTGLALGAHSLRARGTDAAGNTATPVEHPWTIVAASGDTTPPETSLASPRPPQLTNVRSVQFTMSANEAGAVFEVSVDGSAYQRVGNPYSLTNLSDGPHTVRIRAVDTAGNADPTPEEIAWSIDATPPDTLLVSGPSGTTKSTTVKLEFAASETGARLEGRQGNAAFAPVGTTFSVSGLRDGAYSYEVRAIDSAGNVDPTPLIINWRVDTKAPTATLTRTPAKLNNQKAATFEFGSDDATATFEVQLDTGAFAAAASPATLANLADGNHKLSVRAVDAAGNVTTSPAEFTWTVDTIAPQAQITFPTPVSLTDAKQITVTGTASDTNAMSSVRVNGVAATPKNGGGGASALREWRATLSVNAGLNNIVVETRDAAGNVDTNAAQAQIKGAFDLLANPDRVAIDTDNRRALLVDGARIVAIDLSTGARSVFAEAADGHGPDLRTPRGLAIDRANKRLIVTDSELKAVVGIDLANRQRTTLSDGKNGASGVALSSPQGIAVNASGTTAYVVDADAAAVVQVDLQTAGGPRQSISSGSPLAFPLDIALDGSRLLVTDAFVSDGLIAVDLASNGARSAFATGTFEKPTRITIDPLGGRALVSDESLDAIVAVSLADGSRSVLSDNADAGPKLADPKGLAVNPQTGQVLVADSSVHAVLAVDGNTGDRSRLSDDGVGTGPTFRNVQDIALAPDGTRVAALQSDPFAVVLVDLATSSRTAVVDNSTGGGTQLRGASQIALDPNANRAVLLAGDAAGSSGNVGLFTVDLALGTRTPLVADFGQLNAFYDAPADSDLLLYQGNALLAVPYTAPDAQDPNVPVTIDAIVSVPLSGATAREVTGIAQTGPQLRQGDAVGLAVDAGGKLLVVDRGEKRVLGVSLSSGARTTVATSANFAAPDSIAWDAKGNRSFVSDSAADALFEVAANGSVKVVSSSNIGRGPALGTPLGVTAVADTGVVLLFDDEQGALMAVEPSSGDRVIVSR